MFRSNQIGQNHIPRAWLGVCRQPNTSLCARHRDFSRRHNTKLVMLVVRCDARGSRRRRRCAREVGRAVRRCVQGWLSMQSSGAAARAPGRQGHRWLGRRRDDDTHVDRDAQKTVCERWSECNEGQCSRSGHGGGSKSEYGDDDFHGAAFTAGNVANRDRSKKFLRRGHTFRVQKENKPCV